MHLKILLYFLDNNMYKIRRCITTSHKELFHLNELTIFSWSALILYSSTTEESCEKPFLYTI